MALIANVAVWTQPHQPARCFVTALRYLRAIVPGTLPDNIVECLKSDAEKEAELRRIIPSELLDAEPVRHLEFSPGISLGNSSSLASSKPFANIYALLIYITGELDAECCASRQRFPLCVVPDSALAYGEQWEISEERHDACANHQYNEEWSKCPTEQTTPPSTVQTADAIGPNNSTTDHPAPASGSGAAGAAGGSRPAATTNGARQAAPSSTTARQTGSPQSHRPGQDASGRPVPSSHPGQSVVDGRPVGPFPVIRQPPAFQNGATQNTTASQGQVQGRPGYSGSTASTLVNSLRAPFDTPASTTQQSYSFATDRPVPRPAHEGTPQQPRQQTWAPGSVVSGQSSSVNVFTPATTQRASPASQISLNQPSASTSNQPPTSLALAALAAGQDRSTRVHAIQGGYVLKRWVIEELPIFENDQEKGQVLRVLDDEWYRYNASPAEEKEKHKNWLASFTYYIKLKWQLNTRLRRSGGTFTPITCAQLLDDVKAHTAWVDAVTSQTVTAQGPLGQVQQPSTQTSRHAGQTATGQGPLGQVQQPSTQAGRHTGQSATAQSPPNQARQPLTEVGRRRHPTVPGHVPFEYIQVPFTRSASPAATGRGRSVRAQRGSSLGGTPPPGPQDATLHHIPDMGHIQPQYRPQITSNDAIQHALAQQAQAQQLQAQQLQAQQARAQQAQEAQSQAQQLQAQQLQAQQARAQQARAQQARAQQDRAQQAQEAQSQAQQLQAQQLQAQQLQAQQLQAQRFQAQQLQAQQLQAQQRQVQQAQVHQGQAPQAPMNAMQDRVQRNRARRARGQQAFAQAWAPRANPLSAPAQGPRFGLLAPPAALGPLQSASPFHNVGLPASEQAPPNAEAVDENARYDARYENADSDWNDLYQELGRRT